MQTFVPKSRRAKFDLELQIHELNNVPLVSGHSYIKWHVEGSTRADCRSRTRREPIKDHKVVWSYSHNVAGLRLTIGRGSVLQEQYLVMEVHQQYGDGRERIQLGIVRLNLAEYAGLENETRRYLMADSKINSTLKISISLRQIGGDQNFCAPPLKGAQVFSGIAGVIGEQRELDDTRNISLLNSKNRETGITQDMYRRTLAASWQLIPGELNADECIEDIFAGGDGWTSGEKKAKSMQLFDLGKREGMGSDSDSLSQASGGTTTPGSNSNSNTNNNNNKTMTAATLLAVVDPVMVMADGKRKGYAVSVMTGRSSSKITTSASSTTSSVKSKLLKKELDELEGREDLVSWRMPGVRILQR